MDRQGNRLIGAAALGTVRDQPGRYPFIYWIRELPRSIQFGRKRPEAGTGNPYPFLCRVKARPSGPLPTDLRLASPVVPRSLALPWDCGRGCYAQIGSRAIPRSWVARGQAASWLLSASSICAFVRILRDTLLLMCIFVHTPPEITLLPAVRNPDKSRVLAVAF